MDAEDRVRVESVGRVLAWRDNYTGGTAMLKDSFIDLKAEYDDVLAGSGTAMVGKATTAEEYSEKGGDLETLGTTLAEMSDLAAALEPKFPGMQAKYHYRRNMAQADMLATARAFVTMAPGADEANFIEAGMATTFIADLTAQANSFQAQSADASEAKVLSVGTNAAQKAKIRTMGVTKRSIQKMVKVQFKNDPAAIASFNSAAHIEVLYKKKPDPTPPTP